MQKIRVNTDRRQHYNFILLPVPAISGFGQGKSGEHKVTDDLPTALRHKRQGGNVVFGHSDFFDQGHNVGAVRIIGSLLKGTKHHGYDVLVVFGGFRSDCNVFPHITVSFFRMQTQLGQLYHMYRISSTVDDPKGG